MLPSSKVERWTLPSISSLPLFISAELLVMLTQLVLLSALLVRLASESREVLAVLVLVDPRRASRPCLAAPSTQLCSHHSLASAK